MKLKVKNLYGIRGDEVIFDSKENKNMMIFAPNGIGKTSIFKGFNDIKESSQYGGKEIDVPQEFEYSVDGKSISYETNSKCFNNLILINNKYKQIEMPKIEDLLSAGESKKLEKDREDILAFKQSLISEMNLSIYSQYSADDNESSNSIIRNYTKILESQDEKTSTELMDEIKAIDDKLENLDNIHKKMNIMISKTSFTPKGIGEYYDVSSGKHKEVDATAIIDLMIINDIKSKKDGDVDDFGYKPDKDASFYTPISSIPDHYIKTISESYSHEEIDLMISLRQLDNDLLPTLLPKNKTNGKYNTTKAKASFFIKSVADCMDKLNNIKFIMILQKNKGRFLKIKKRIDNTNKATVDNINKNIEKLNSLVNNEMLDWKISFSPVSSVNDQLNSSIIGEEISSENVFAEYASEGQKNILSILTQLIPLYNREGIVVMDDAMTSFDNQHINELLNALSIEEFKNVKLIVLSHNFEMLRSFSFNGKIASETKFIIFDKMKSGKYKTIDANPNQIREIMSVNRAISGSEQVDPVIQLCALSSLMREALANILMTQKFPIKGLLSRNREAGVVAAVKSIQDEIDSLDDGNKILLDIVEFFDQCIRHFKRNILIGDLKKLFNKKVLGTFASNIPVINKIKEILDNIINKYGEDKVFGDVVTAIEINWESILNIDEFILAKIFFGLKIRFVLEKKKYYDAGDQKVIQKWESETEWSIANSLLDKKHGGMNNFNVNFLAHANNIQWAKIIEYPIYKLEKMGN